jgi:ABC-type Fe3+-siderophore transport system permease subunit
MNPRPETLRRDARPRGLDTGDAGPPTTTGEQAGPAVSAASSSGTQNMAPATKTRRGVGRVRGVSALALLGAALVLAVILATAIGAVGISPLTTAGVLWNQLPLVPHVSRAWSHADELILLQLRLPRVVGAALVGAALAVAGTLFQGLLRNPLADPFLLGTSAGAALGAAIGFVVPAVEVAQWLGFSLVAILGFAGALGAAAAVYAIATRRGQTPVVTLLLAGVAVSAILSAAQTLVISLQQRTGLRILSLYYWLAGGVNVQSWAQIWVLLPLVALAIAGALLLAPALDAFALGERMAAHLGLPVERAKLAITALAALLVAAAVSISGLVGFVGLVAPHVCRITLGPRHRLLVPASALAGAIFVVLADLLARTIASPSELPLGVVTALVGGPFFLWLLRGAGRAYRW